MHRVTTAHALSMTNNSYLAARLVYLKHAGYNASDWLHAREAAIALIWGHIILNCTSNTSFHGDKSAFSQFSIWFFFFLHVISIWQWSKDHCLIVIYWLSGVTINVKGEICCYKTPECWVVKIWMDPDALTNSPGSTDSWHIDTMQQLLDWLLHRDELWKAIFAGKKWVVACCYQMDGRVLSCQDMNGPRCFDHDSRGSADMAHGTLQQLLDCGYHIEMNHHSKILTIFQPRFENPRFTCFVLLKPTIYLGPVTGAAAR
jgi:hypothetical protein